MSLVAASALGAGSSVLSGSPSKFESGDGNMAVDTTGDGDWNSAAGSCSGSAVDCTSGNYVHITDGNAGTTNDLSWKAGQKQDTQCPVLVNSKNSAKDTFTDVASDNETARASGGGLGDTFLYGATIRQTTNGSASENVELNQVKGTSTCSIQRSAGDKLIAINYTTGGTTVTFSVLTWVTSSSGFTDSAGNSFSGTCFVSNDTPPCWSSTVKTPAQSAANGEASQTEITPGQNGINGQDLVAGQFAEFGIDLTAAGIIPAGSCKSFPQTVWESRSSGSSFVSNPEDIEIEQHTINNCAPTTTRTGQKAVIADFAQPSGFGTPTGTVDFKLFTNSGCTGTPLYDSGSVTLSSGTASTKDAATQPPTLNTNGTYYWLVSYSGDANNQPSTSPCGTEQTTISGNTAGVDP
jgi:hypothetical protein